MAKEVLGPSLVEPSAELITPVSHLKDYAKLVEMAGRTCYKSMSRSRDGSSDNFIKKIIERGHESVIEHCSITFRIVCSRACSHQLVRHRIAAYSQESQRYCDYGKLGFQVIVPPSVREDPIFQNQFVLACRKVYEYYIWLRDSGVPPEDARFVLPNATKTEVMTTFNLRMWRHVLKERWLNKHAQWEIRKVMGDVASVLGEHLPMFFDDLIRKYE